ncbi:putative zinc finger protein 37-like [Scophthalmus maximus]|uniref:Putative zinc finger protein 37-like n=1 Tax=Scophthalmus maximus TaxID=52904 RepID=A0A2U9BS22_SCOMX|nr:putative zinc finger protein 37-like [Scophthalmus maximus]
MSDPETLAVTFRAQLSDVTRLVEDGLLEEVRRRGRETESLRLRLQWTERRRGGRGGGKTGTCVDCARRDVELSTDMADAGSKEQQDGASRCSAGETEGGPVDGWTRGRGPEAAGDPSAGPAPEGGSQKGFNSCLYGSDD